MPMRFLHQSNPALTASLHLFTVLNSPARLSLTPDLVDYRSTHPLSSLLHLHSLPSCVRLSLRRR